MKDESTTHFGFEQVATGDKAGRVADVFHSVASKYDLMNDAMSFGIHRLWKRFTIEMCGLREGHIVLDLAGGTGDLALKQARKVGDSGHVVLADINASMLQEGRDRIIDNGLIHRISTSQCNAEILQSMYRVLKPGGRLCVLEFSRPLYEPLEKLYDFYSFKILPGMGELIAKDRDSYQYLAESIRMHPDQDTLKQIMLDEAGFDEVEVSNMTGGIVALHRGFKY